MKKLTNEEKIKLDIGLKISPGVMLKSRATGRRFKVLGFEGGFVVLKTGTKSPPLKQSYHSARFAYEVEAK